MTTDNNNPLSVLIVGGGMYVTGKGAPNSKGTILPALFEARRARKVGRITVVTTNEQSARDAAERAADLGELMGVSGDVDVFPKQGVDPDAFLAVADEMKPDATIVSVPDHEHARICVPLVERGLHCLVVKPLAGSVEEGAAMAAAAAKSNVVAQVEFHKRLDESNLLLRDRVRSGQLGQPLYAVIEYSQRKLIPSKVFRSWADKSNIFQYLGVHYVDLLQWALDYEPVQVSAWGQKAYLSELGIDTWDAMQVVVQWRGPEGNSFVSTHITNWIDPDCSSAMSDQKINLVGTLGRFQADQKHRGVQVVADESGVDDINPYFTTSTDDDLALGQVFGGYGIASVMRFIDDVIAVEFDGVAVNDLQRNRPSFEACLTSTRVLEGALKSLRENGTPIKV